MRARSREIESFKTKHNEITLCDFSDLVKNWFSRSAKMRILVLIRPIFNNVDVILFFASFALNSPS